MSELRQKSLVVSTDGRGTVDLTAELTRFVAQAGVSVGICSVFVHHTSASLIICENADSTVRLDLERFFADLCPDGDGRFEHIAEGADDMPAHVRSVLTASSLSVPIAGGRCQLGTWQGVFLWEHRSTSHRRRVTLTAISA